jgi:hypothetical protein
MLEKKIYSGKKNLTVKQKSIIKLWVKAWYETTHVYGREYRYRNIPWDSSPSDMAEAMKEDMKEDGTYEVLERINNIDVLDIKIFSFANKYYKEINRRQYQLDRKGPFAFPLDKEIKG